MTGVERQPRSVVDAVTDAAIAALLPADRRLSMRAAEYRDRAHVDAALDRLLPRSPTSEAERARMRRAALDRVSLSRARRVAAARQRGLDATNAQEVVPVTVEREAEPRILPVVAAHRYVDVSRSDQVAALRDAVRVDRVLDGPGPAPHVLQRRTRVPVRARARNLLP